MATDIVEQKPLHKYPVKSGRDILDAQYKGGRSIIEKAEWARLLFDGLRRRCPHVPEEQLVRLFHESSQSQLEFIQGAATFEEYNAAHPLGRRRVRAKPRPVLRAVPAPVAPVKVLPKPAVAPKVAPKVAPPVAPKVVPVKAKPAPPPLKAVAKPKPKAPPKAAPKAKARLVKAAPRPAAAKAKRKR